MLTKADLDRVESKLRLAYRDVKYIPNTDQFIVGGEGDKIGIVDAYGNILMPAQKQVKYEIKSNKLDGTYIIGYKHVVINISSAVFIYVCNLKSFYVLGGNETILRGTPLIQKMLGEISEEHGESQHWLAPDEDPVYTVAVYSILDILGRTIIKPAIQPIVLGFRFIEFEDFDNRYRYDRENGISKKIGSVEYC